MPPSSRDGFIRPAAVAPTRPGGAIARTDFYREELARHQHHLRQQRGQYSERVIGEVDAALTRLISEVEDLCAQDNGDEIVSSLLREIDGVTRLSVCSDQKNAH